MHKKKYFIKIFSFRILPLDFSHISQEYLYAYPQIFILFKNFFSHISHEFENDLIEKLFSQKMNSEDIFFHGSYQMTFAYI